MQEPYSFLRMPDSHGQVVAEFLAAGVQFLVIGGHAVVFHGHTRPTHDLDLWICPTVENVDRLPTPRSTRLWH